MTSEVQIHRRPAMLAAGFTDQELRRMRRTGQLSRVRRGAYLTSAEPSEVESRHRLEVHAAIGELADGAVVSHGSAAAVLGLPVWRLPLRRVAVTRARRSGGRRDPVLHMRSAPLRDDEIVIVDGVPVTSVARTVVDLARMAPFESGVVVADAALAGQAVTREELDVVLARCKGWPGCPKARRVVAFAEASAESVGESRSRVAMAMAGLPEPVPQFEVHDRGGRLVARADFGWPDRKVLGEFDGAVKYGRLVPDGESPGDVVFAEKRREDDLRARGYTVVRWTWDDLANFDAVATRLNRALRR